MAHASSLTHGRWQAAAVGLKTLLSPASASFILLLALGVRVFQLRGIWHSFPAEMFDGADATAVAARVPFIIEHIFAAGRLDGWLPTFLVGHDATLINGSGFFVFVAAIRWLSLGLATTNQAILLSGVTAFLLLPLVVSYLGRQLGFCARHAAIAGLLSTGLSVFSGIGLEGAFEIALLPNQIGAVFALWGLGLTLSILHNPSRRATVCLAVALMAVALTHIVTIQIFLLLGPLVLGSYLHATRRMPSRASLLALGAAGLLSLGLAAVWLLPNLAHWGLRGGLTGWANPGLSVQLSEMIEGKYLFPGWQGKAVAAGWLAALLLCRQQAAVFAVMFSSLCYLVLAHLLTEYFPGFWTAQLVWRGLSYIGVLALFPLVASADKIFGLARHYGQHALCGVATLLVLIGTMPIVDRIGPVPQPAPEIAAAAALLKEKVPLGARFAAQIKGDVRVGRQPVANWITWKTGVSTLNNFNPEIAYAWEVMGIPDQIGVLSPDELADTLLRVGVSHLLTTTAEVTRQHLAAERYEALWQQGDFGIFALKARPGMPAAESLISTPNSSLLVLDTRLEDIEHWHYEVEARESVQVSIPVGYSSRWRVSIDGQAAPSAPSADKLLSFDVPAGRHMIDVRYEIGTSYRIGACVSLLSVLLSIGIWRQQRSTGRAAGA